MQAHCKYYSVIKESNDCWKCVTRVKLGFLSAYMCRVAHMPEYRLHVLNLDFETLYNCGYAPRQLKMFREVEE